MKKQFKRNLSILLSLAILISALSGIGITASAESQITENDLTGTTVASEVTLSPSDFKNINTVISNNMYGGSMNFPINSFNKFEVNSTDTDVVLTLTLPGNKDTWNAIGGIDFTTFTAEGLKIKSYSYEYVGTLSSRQAQPAVLKVTDGTSHVGSYISPMRYSADGFAKYVINDFTETDGVTKITEVGVYSVSGASTFDRSNTYNFKVDVEYTYDEKGACRGVTVTYNYRDKDDRSTENMPSPVSQTIDFTSKTIAGKNPSLAAQGIVAVEPVIALRLNLGKTTNKQLISTYSNLAVVTEQTTDYTQDVLSFVNGNPIVIDIKNDATADYSDKGTDALNAKSAFNALDPTVQGIITDNGYYNSALIDDIISHIGDIKKSDLNAGTTAVKEETLTAADLTYTDIVSNNYVSYYAYKATIGKNGTAYASSATNDILTLTLNATKADLNVDISNTPLSGDIYTFANEIEGAKIKSFSYIFTGNLIGAYGKPVILKGNDGKLIAPGFIYGTAVTTPSAPNFKVYTQSTTEGVTTISNTATSQQLAHLKNAETIQQADVNTYTVKVEYNYGEGDVCTGAKVTYTCTVEGTEYSFGMSIKLTDAMFSNKDVSISGVDSTITQITPYIGFRAANLTTVDGVAETKYSNVSVTADKTKDYTEDILGFVNAHKVLIDIKNGLDCSLRKDEVAAAKAAYEALADENLKSLIVANGYYDADKINEITKSTAEEIVSELTGTINMPGATVKMNQIDNNNQLRFTADYTMFKSVVTKYADRVAVTERGIRLLAGNKDAETLKTTGNVYTTSKDYISYEDDNGATKTGDYWVVGGTADYVSTKVSVLAYAKITVDGNEYTVYSDAISRSIVSVIRNILGAQDTVAVDNALATVTSSNEAYKDFTRDDLMVNKVGTNTTKQAFVKAVFTQFCTDAGYIK